jgi:hypothetical protein
MNEHLWYRPKPKKKPSRSRKLRQEIIDALPFDMDVNKADLVLETICRMIIEGVIKDGFTRITGFGKFIKKYEPPGKYGVRITTPGVHGSKPAGRIAISKGRHYIGFTMHRKTRRKIEAKLNESSGEDQGT